MFILVMLYSVIITWDCSIISIYDPFECLVLLWVSFPSHACWNLLFLLKVGLFEVWLPMFFAGISLKTQELFAIVFAARYLDIFTNFISLYNTIMKLIFLGSSFSIVWYIRRHRIVRRSYDKDQDTFRHLFLILPCLLLALVINEKFTFQEVFMYSILFFLDSFDSVLV